MPYESRIQESEFILKRAPSRNVKIIHATPMGSIMSEGEVREFLSSGITNLQLATVDKRGEPVIQPVWYYYDETAGRIYINTYRDSIKAQNIRRKNAIYFSVDEDSFPYRCVKGKARADVLEQVDTNLALTAKIMTKYLGSADHPNAVHILNTVRSGESVVLSLRPLYYSTWCFSQSQQ
jgi:nitroimidazol reductase NimA-like FMN-containing flavoprotein (pyridoxamine 5'-phosphate oxidase superfamily)